MGYYRERNSNRDQFYHRTDTYVKSTDLRPHEKQQTQEEQHAHGKVKGDSLEPKTYLEVSTEVLDEGVETEEVVDGLDLVNEDLGNPENLLGVEEMELDEAHVAVDEPIAEGDGFQDLSDEENEYKNQELGDVLI
ncbi:hypothetical protein N665_0387s0006 [Sinapis alba]|nr:hypothetical protein N665_0387s0006 [Sinapis alba]